MPLVPKRRKVPKLQRHQEILALQVAGLTQEEIAAQLGVSRQSIVRDLRELQPTQDAINAKLAQLQTEITALLPLKQRAEKYAQLAKSAKNEAVSLGALQRIDDLDGIVTQKELVRTRRDEAAQPQPMFIMPSGSHVNVTIHQQKTTTSSNDLPTNSARQVKSLKPNER